jgi:hypothetical protein
MKSLLILLGLVSTAAMIHAELIGYTYDSAGRLNAAQYGSGKTASWQFDSAGNLTRTVNSVIVDSDGDGMEDAWETLHFQNKDRDGSGDFDEDGFSDLAEFLAGTLPKDSESLLRLQENVTNTVVQTTISWTAVSGKTYRVQYKDELGAPGWNDLPGDVTASGPLAFKVDATSAGKPRRFYRITLVP